MDTTEALVLDLEGPSELMKCASELSLNGERMTPHLFQGIYAQQFLQLVKSQEAGSERSLEQEARYSCQSYSKPVVMAAAEVGRSGFQGHMESLTTLLL